MMEKLYHTLTWFESLETGGEIGAGCLSASGLWAKVHLAAALATGVELSSTGTVAIATADL